MRDPIKQGSGKDGCAEADESGAKTCGAAFRGVAEAENAGDARGERASVCRKAKGRSGAPFFHGGESARVTEMIAAGGDGDVVAAVFALPPQAALPPPTRP